MSVRVSCCFCDGLVRGASKAPWDAVLYDSGRFIVTPSKGSLVPGWMLVVAKQHTLCSGAIASSELTELLDCLGVAQDLVRTNFGEATVFEHGPSRTGLSLGCGIDHLHLHVVPLSFSLKRATTTRFPEVNWEEISDLSGTSPLFASNLSYGLVHEPGSTMSWCHPPKQVRQFFRQVIAAELGIPEQFDYAQFPQLPNVLRTLDAFTQPSL
jgi:ATP adenylyltransferase